jgi:hypothetical protein
MMKSLVFLPAYPELSKSSRARLVTVINRPAAIPQTRARVGRLRRA